MALSGRTQRDDRRRRVLMDELRGGGEQNAENTGGGQRSANSEIVPRTYSEAARRENQPPVTSLIPTGRWTLSALMLLSLLIVSGIEVLDVQVRSLAPEPLTNSVAFLDANAPGSLAAWYSSTVFLLATLAAIAVFHLRRHKLDDYRGRYRLWVPAALALLIASIDAATGLHQLVASSLVYATGRTLMGDGTVWWVATLGTAFLLLGLRMLLEIRQSRAAAMFGTLAVACYLTASAIHLEWFLPSNLDLPSELRVSWLDRVVGSSAALWGHSSVLWAIVCYCRYVYLDAQDALRRPRRAAEAKPRSKAASHPATKEKPATTPSRTGKRRTDLGTPAAATNSPEVAEPPKKAAAPKKKAPKTPAPQLQAVANETESFEELDEEALAGLSKAERRRQRKLARRQKRAA